MRPIEIHDRGRGPELKGTRITVYDVVPYHLNGWSMNRIAAVLNLSTDEVEALLRYFEEHREAVMAHHNKIEERNARGNPPEIEEKVKASHAKLLARREEIRRRKQEEAADTPIVVDRNPAARPPSGGVGVV